MTKEAVKKPSAPIRECATCAYVMIPSGNFPCRQCDEEFSAQVEAGQLADYFPRYVPSTAAAQENTVDRRAFLEMTDRQQELVYPLLRAMHNGEALFAQVFPDGIHIVRISADQTAAIQAITGKTGLSRYGWEGFEAELEADK